MIILLNLTFVTKSDRGYTGVATKANDAIFSSYSIIIARKMFLSKSRMILLDL